MATSSVTLDLSWKPEGPLATVATFRAPLKLLLQTSHVWPRNSTSAGAALLVSPKVVTGEAEIARGLASSALGLASSAPGLPTITLGLPTTESNCRPSRPESSGRNDRFCLMVRILQVLSDQRCLLYLRGKIGVGESGSPHSPLMGNAKGVALRFPGGTCGRSGDPCGHLE